MKLTLTYHLPRELDKLNDALHGADYRAALEGVISWLRTQRKYADWYGRSANEAFDAAWEAAWEEIKERGVEVDW